MQGDKHFHDSWPPVRGEGGRAMRTDPGQSDGPFDVAVITARSTCPELPAGAVQVEDGPAEVTLIFQHGEFKALPWTYPDYASDEVRSLLVEGGGETAWGFVEARLADRVTAYHAPLLLGGSLLF